jgi:uncharacterized protein
VSSLPSASDNRSQQQAKSGYFTPLASAKNMLLTMLNLDGTLVSVPVHGVVDGDRAYFRTWRRSGTWKRLRQDDWVQVTPCTLLGLCRYGPTRNATARLLAGEEASMAAEKLARKYSIRHGFLSTFVYGLIRCPAVYYELHAEETVEPRADEPAGLQVYEAANPPSRRLPRGELCRRPTQFQS